MGMFAKSQLKHRICKFKKKKKKKKKKIQMVSQRQEMLFWGRYTYTAYIHGNVYLMDLVPQ